VSGSAAWVETAPHTANPTAAATAQQVITLVKLRLTVLLERMLTLSSSRARVRRLSRTLPET
jgi:hypothetical protein